MSYRKNVFMVFFASTLTLIVIALSGCFTSPDSAPPDPSRKVDLGIKVATNESMSVKFDRTSNGQYFFECAYSYSAPKTAAGISALLLRIDNGNPITLKGSAVDPARQIGYNLVKRAELVQFLVSKDQANQLLNCNSSMTLEFVTQTKIDCNNLSYTVTQYRSVITQIKAFINHWNNKS